jgi:hypothetical protein
MPIGVLDMLREVFNDVFGEFNTLEKVGIFSTAIVVAFAFWLFCMFFLPNY